MYIFKCLDRYKIGWAVNVPRRLGQVRRHSPYPVDEIFGIETKHARQIEADLHREFRSCRRVGEWFELSDPELSRAIEFATDRAAQRAAPLAPLQIEFDLDIISPEGIARLRKQLGLSVIDFAKRCQVSRDTVYFWESGHSHPLHKRQLVLVEMAKKLKPAKVG